MIKTVGTNILQLRKVKNLEPLKQDSYYSLT